MLHALANARTLADDGWRDDVAVVLDGERISALIPHSDPSLRDMQQQDLGGAMLLPGFIDVQVNGGGGALFNFETHRDGLKTMMAAHASFGTVAMLPTLITDDVEVIASAETSGAPLLVCHITHSRTSLCRCFMLFLQLLAACLESE